MNFVGNDEYVVAKANFADACEFFTCPDASDGIVWIAKDEYFGFFVCRFPFEIVEVDVIGVAFAEQGAGHDFASVVTDC